MSTSGSATWALISDTSNATIDNAATIATNAQHISTNGGQISTNGDNISTNQANISIIVNHAATPVECAPLASPTFTGTPKVSSSVSLLPSNDDSTKLATTRWVKSKPWSNPVGGGIAHLPDLPAGTSQSTPGFVTGLHPGTAVRVTMIGGGGGGGVAGGNQPGSSDGTGGESRGSSAGGGGGGGAGGVVIFWIQAGDAALTSTTWNVGNRGAAVGGTESNAHISGTGDGGATTWGLHNAYGGKQGGNAAPPANGASPGPGVGGAGGVVDGPGGDTGLPGGAGQVGGSSVAWDSDDPTPGFGGPGAHGWRASYVGAGGAGAFYAPRTDTSDGLVDWHAAGAGGPGMVIFEWFS